MHNTHNNNQLLDDDDSVHAEVPPDADALEWLANQSAHVRRTHTPTPTPHLTRPAGTDTHQLTSYLSYCFGSPPPGQSDVLRPGSIGLGFN